MNTPNVFKLSGPVANSPNKPDCVLFTALQTALQGWMLNLISSSTNAKKCLSLGTSYFTAYFKAQIKQDP